MKSTIISVVGPAWIWTQDPKAGILGLSYNAALNQRDATLSRQLIESEWFKIIWPEIRLRDDQNAKSDYRNTLGGWRLSTTIEGRGTGEHPAIVIWDDPLKAADAPRSAARKACLEYYRSTLATRGMAKGVRHVVGMQRLHVDDPSSIATEANKRAKLKKEPEPWMHVMLPMEYDPEWKMQDWGFGGDWRTKKGELLDPVRFPIKKLSSIYAVMFDLDKEAQYGQNPKTRKGRFIKTELLKYIQAKDVPTCDEWVRFFDKAATEDGGCNTAGVLMGIKRLGPDEANYYIRNVHAGQWDVDEVENNIEACAKSDNLRYRGRYKVGLEEEGGSGGKVSVRSTEKRLRGYTVISVRTDGKSKETRMKPFANAVARGEVYVVEEDWTPDYVDELRDFPDGKLKDKADASSGALTMLEGTLVEEKKDDEFMVAGLDPNRKKCLGCDRMAIGGADYCCEKCEIAFEMGAVCTEHDLECDRRA